MLTPSGALELSVIKHDYDPLTAWAEIRRVVIYRKNGSQDVLDTSMVMDYAAPARAIYWGAREKMIAVGRLEPGDAVEVFLFKKGFTYALLQEEEDERYIPPMRGHFYDIVPFWSDYPQLEKVYQIRLPADKKLQYQVYNGELSVLQNHTATLQEFIFTAFDLKPLKAEPGMVDRSDVSLKLLLSTSSDWESKSRWFYGVNEDYGSFHSTPEIKEKVDEILKGAADETDSIARLTHWCADEIRYSGISMGVGEGFTLHTGDMTFTDRCGVCKDKAGILITMLRAAGFQSFPAMTMAGSRIEKIPADQFNHCVTVVKRRNGNYQLLDPTWVPFVRELWSSAEQQQNYLMGVPESAGLEETEISPPENHYFKIIANSEIMSDGTLQGRFTLTAEGQSDAAVRRMFTSSFRSRWKIQLERELVRISPYARITQLDFGDPYDYQSGPISIIIHYLIPNYALITEKEIIFTPLTASHLFKNSQGQLSMNLSPAERKFPFRDRCSREVELLEFIRLPKPCTLTYYPQPQEVKGEYSAYTGAYELEGNTLKMKQQISFAKRVYDAIDWKDYKQSVRNQNQMAEEKVILTINK